VLGAIGPRHVHFDHAAVVKLLLREATSDELLAGVVLLRHADAQVFQRDEIGAIRLDHHGHVVFRDRRLLAVLLVRFRGDDDWRRPRGRRVRKV
jgi:hypothetical protein